MPPKKAPSASLKRVEEEAWKVLERAEGLAEGKDVVARCVLFSGGNDSTVLAHFLRTTATHLVHVNTGIGIEQTREFVRGCADKWGLPLIEVSPPPGSTYEELVVDQGFPGPGHHWKMYQRLKERGLREVRRMFVTQPRSQRIMFYAGRRRDESRRRANVPELERTGSIVWASPLVDWTNENMKTYRETHLDVPRNEVSDMLHMSGECGCGAFASVGELEEWSFFFPEFGQEVERLEGLVRAAGHPEPRCRWGWGAGQQIVASKSGKLCSSCDARMEPT